MDHYIYHEKVPCEGFDLEGEALGTDAALKPVFAIAGRLPIDPREGTPNDL